MAEVETGRSNWVGMQPIVMLKLYPAWAYVLNCMQAAVAEHAGKVALSVTQTGMPTSAAQAQAEAFAVWVRSLLVQGNDHPARLLAEQVSHA